MVKYFGGGEATYLRQNPINHNDLGFMSILSQPEYLGDIVECKCLLLTDESDHGYCPPKHLRIECPKVNNSLQEISIFQYLVHPILPYILKYVLRIPIPNPLQILFEFIDASKFSIETVAIRNC